MIHTTTLPNGNLQHKIDGWVGIQNPNESMVKTKWRKTNYKYWEINGYTLTRNAVGNITCECKGYIFRKKCRHIQQLKDNNE